MTAAAGVDPSSAGWCERILTQPSTNASGEQRETFDAILSRSAFAIGSDVNEQRRLARESGGHSRCPPT